MCQKENSTTEYAQIFHFIQSHRNGEVVDGMKARSIEYAMSYGLSINQINSFGKTLHKDNSLAHKLWNEPMRETKLFALHVFDPQTISDSEIETLVAELTNNELVEQAVFVLLCKTDILAERIAAWCTSNVQLTALTGFSLISRMALLRKDLPHEYFGTFFAVMGQCLATANRSLQQEMAKAVTAIARRSPELKQQASQWIETHSSAEAACIKIASEELQYV